MKTAYQRGFRLGVMAPADLAAGYELAWKANIPLADYADCAEEELRFERGLVVEALEAKAFAMHGLEEDEEKAAAAAFARVPEHLHAGLLRYLDHHIKPGSFMRAVLEGDLFQAFGQADIHSRAGMWELVEYIYNYAPPASWGNTRRVEYWLTPPIPILKPKALGPPLSIIDGKTACPRCGETHSVHYIRAEPHKITLPGEAMMGEHTVQYVWCQRVYLEVVGIDEREVEQ